MASAYRLRPARPSDGEDLRQIEVEAGAAFRTVGLQAIADDEPLSIEGLAAYAAAGHSWVAIAARGDVVAYVLVDRIDDRAHVEQVSVHPDHQGCGIGRRLLDQVDRWARGEGLRAVTLTTFTDVAWNGPLYAHLRFVVLAEHDVGPELAALREQEAQHGLDPALRICMVRAVRR